MYTEVTKWVSVAVLTTAVILWAPSYQLELNLVLSVAVFAMARFAIVNRVTTSPLLFISAITSLNPGSQPLQCLMPRVATEGFDAA